METEIIFKTVDEIDDNDKVKRLVFCDDAFSLLYDIKEKIRNYSKHEEWTNEKANNVLIKIREDIEESGLLQMYN